MCSKPKIIVSISKQAPKVEILYTNLTSYVLLLSVHISAMVLHNRDVGMHHAGYCACALLS